MYNKANIGELVKPFSLILANFKGGCGKTSLGCHLAWRAAERQMRVLFVDCDRQGDGYRRLVGDKGDLADMPSVAWRGGQVVHSPDTYNLPPTGFDLIVVDTAPGLQLPQGPPLDLLVLPVDGVDAARNAWETIAEAEERGIRRVLVVFNGIQEGGKVQARRFAEMKEHLPAGVTLWKGGHSIPRGGCIKRSALNCRPAWVDVWKGRDARELEAFCDAMLEIARRKAA